MKNINEHHPLLRATIHPTLKEEAIWRRGKRYLFKRSYVCPRELCPVLALKPGIFLFAVRHNLVFLPPRKAFQATLPFLSPLVIFNHEVLDCCLYRPRLGLRRRHGPHGSHAGHYSSRQSTNVSFPILSQVTDSDAPDERFCWTSSSFRPLFRRP